MHKSIDNLALINDQIKKKFGLKSNLNIIAISKTFPMKEIEHLINHGHVHFGENKVQEAVNKWTDIKNSLKHVQLHMVGKLQTNKTKYVISNTGKPNCIKPIALSLLMPKSCFIFLLSVASFSASLLPRIALIVLCIYPFPTVSFLQFLLHPSGGAA